MVDQLEADGLNLQVIVVTNTISAVLEQLFLLRRYWSLCVVGPFPDTVLMVLSDRETSLSVWDSSL